MLSNFRHDVWYHDCCQTGTAVKSIISNTYHAVRYRNFCCQLSVYIKIGTTAQWIGSKTAEINLTPRFQIRNINIFQIGASEKSTFFNFRHAVWYRD